MEENNIIWLKRGRGRYGVDALGHVYSNASGAIKKLRPATNRHGYQQVFLCFGAKDKKRVAVHRLVAEAFLAPDETRPYINHKNGQKIDNRLSNLEWVTAKENAIHAIRSGLYVPPRKLTDQSLARARQLRAKGWKLREIAEDVGCSVTRAHEITKEIVADEAEIEFLQAALLAAKFVNSDRRGAPPEVEVIERLEGVEK